MQHLDHYSPALQNDVHLVCPEVSHSRQRGMAWLTWLMGKVPMDATDHLLAGGVSPNDIDSVVYSHMHWDHIVSRFASTAAQDCLRPFSGRYQVVQERRCRRRSRCDGGCVSRLAHTRRALHVVCPRAAFGQGTGAVLRHRQVGSVGAI